MQNAEKENKQPPQFSRDIQRPASHLYFAAIMLILLHDKLEVGVAVVGAYIVTVARSIARGNKSETFDALRKEFKRHGFSDRTLYAAIPVVGAIVAIALLLHEIASIYFL